MRLRFEPELEHQRRAIAAVTDLFRGAETRRIGHPGAANQLPLTLDELRWNLADVQRRAGLPTTTPSGPEELRFTVEMETGTGKTYVYLRTVHELHRRYGLSRFILVVPSLAVRAGALQALATTREHLRGLYDTAIVVTEYDSARPAALRAFADAAGLHVMVMTVGAINKREVNRLYRGPEGDDEQAPIHLIRSLRPVVLIDEPQSVDGGAEQGRGGGRGRAAIEAMCPLFTLRYSATHRDRHHMVHRLDAISAYNQGLVKAIRVASARVEGDTERPRVALLALQARRGQAPRARLALDVAAPGGARRVERLVGVGDDLERVTGRAVYRGLVVSELDASAGTPSLRLSRDGQPLTLRPGDVYAGVDPEILHRALIRRTIQEHLRRSQDLRPRGIKVLSLFFIDRVERYRRHGPGGSANRSDEKGPLARIFEEEFVALAASPEHAALYAGQDLAVAAAAAHGGYFSQDRRTGRLLDTEESSAAGREAAEAAYRLILGDRERLLSLDTPLAFVFSHSALREGWDNPNVFQICALREVGAETARRQMIGRGLRLAVDQRGERVRDSEVNRLTVIAGERYEDFAARYQAELEAEVGGDLGGRGGPRRAVERILLSDADAPGDLPSPRPDARQDPRPRVLADGPALDPEALIRACAAAIAALPPLPAARLVFQTAGLALDARGVRARAEQGASEATAIEEPRPELPDPLSELERPTRLTRRSLARILRESGRLADLERNPWAFLALAAGAMRRVLGSASPPARTVLSSQPSVENPP